MKKQPILELIALVRYVINSQIATSVSLDVYHYRTRNTYMCMVPCLVSSTSNRKDRMRGIENSGKLHMTYVSVSTM